MHAANFCVHWVAALLCTKGGGEGHLPLCAHQEFNYPRWLRTPAKLVISLSRCITTADAQMWGRSGGGGGVLRGRWVGRGGARNRQLLAGWVDTAIHPAEMHH